MGSGCFACEGLICRGIWASLGPGVQRAGSDEQQVGPWTILLAGRGKRRLDGLARVARAWRVSQYLTRAFVAAVVLQRGWTEKSNRSRLRLYSMGILRPGLLLYPVLANSGMSAIAAVLTESCCWICWVVPAVPDQGSGWRGRSHLTRVLGRAFTAGPML